MKFKLKCVYLGSLVIYSINAADRPHRISHRTTASLLLLMSHCCLWSPTASFTTKQMHCRCHLTRYFLEDLQIAKLIHWGKSVDIMKHLLHPAQIFSISYEHVIKFLGCWGGGESQWFEVISGFPPTKKHPKMKPPYSAFSAPIT